MTDSKKSWRRIRARVSLDRDRKSSGSYESFRVTWFADGKRLRKRFPNQSQALEFARTINAERQSTDSFRLIITPEQAASIARAEQLLKPLGVSVEVACAEYVEARKRIGNGRLLDAADHFQQTQQAQHSKPVAEAVEEFLKAKEQDGTGSRQIENLTHRLRFWVKSQPPTCGSINAKSIDGYLRREQEERKWSGLTRNHARIAIGNFCGWAKLKGYLPRSWSEMEFVPAAKHVREPIRIFTPKQAISLLGAANGEARTFLAIGMLSGIRPSEILRMQWTDIDWERNEIHVGRQKVRTAGHRIAPLLPALRAFLGPIQGNGLLVPFTIDRASKSVTRVAATAGIEWIADGPRHSFVSYRLSVLGDIQRVAEETGTSANTLRRFYRSPVSRQTAEEWFGMRPEAAPKG